MKKTLSIASLAFAIVLTAVSCKKSTTFEKGSIVFNLDGKTFSSKYSANATYMAPGILSLMAQGNLSGDILPTQVQITFEEAVEGTSVGSDKLVIGGSKGADTFATHWDNQLVGSASGTIDVLNSDECKGTFEATMKTKGGKAYKLTDGKFWLDL